MKNNEPFKSTKKSIKFKPTASVNKKRY